MTDIHAFDIKYISIFLICLPYTKQALKPRWHENSVQLLLLTVRYNGAQTPLKAQLKAIDPAAPQAIDAHPR